MWAAANNKALVQFQHYSSTSSDMAVLHLQEAPDVLYQVCIAAAAQLRSFRPLCVNLCSTDR